MYHRFKNLKNKEKGQGLVEYALILVLVAIVVISALMILGPVVGNVFSKINSSLSTVSTGGGAAAAPVVPATEVPPCSSTPAFESWKTNMNAQCNARPGVGKFVQYSCNAVSNTTSATCFAASSVGQTPIPYNQGSFSH